MVPLPYVTSSERARIEVEFLLVHGKDGESGTRLCHALSRGACASPVPMWASKERVSGSEISKQEFAPSHLHLIAREDVDRDCSNFGAAASGRANHVLAAAGAGAPSPPAISGCCSVSGNGAGWDISSVCGSSQSSSVSAVQLPGS